MSYKRIIVIRFNKISHKFELNFNKFGGTNGYLLYAIRQEMLDKGYTEDDLNLRGLKVISTFEEKKKSIIKMIEHYNQTGKLPFELIGFLPQDIDEPSNVMIDI